MNLHRLLQQRAVAGQPVRVGLIGAGKFGSTGSPVKSMRY
jgi:predicted homoserine dehydrogenase-like protein